MQEVPNVINGQKLYLCSPLKSLLVPSNRFAHRVFSLQKGIRNERVKLIVKCFDLDRIIIISLGMW